MKTTKTSSKSLALLQTFNRACKEIGEAESTKLEADLKIVYRWQNREVTETIKAGWYVPDVGYPKLVAWCKLQYLAKIGVIKY